MELRCLLRLIRIISWIFFQEDAFVVRRAGSCEKPILHQFYDEEILHVVQQLGPV